MHQVKRVFVQETPSPALQMELLPVVYEDLQIIRGPKEVSVFCRGFCFFTYELGDRFSRDYCIVQLHVSGGVKLKDLARLFDLSLQHCSNAVVRHRRDGVNALISHVEKRYGNRKKIDPKIGDFIVRRRDQGCGYREISQMIRFRFHQSIKAQSLRAWVSKHHRELKGESREEKQIDFFKERDEPKEVIVSDWHWNGYAGSMILYGMIEWR